LENGKNALAITGSSRFPKNVALLRQCHFDGNFAALARFLDVNRYTIMGWERGTQSPSLLLLADLSRKVKVTPEVLLSKDLQSGDFTIGAGVDRKLSRRTFVAPPRVDYDHVRRVLEDAAGDDGTVPTSLSKLAARLRCRTTTLQRRFPDLVKRIKDRYREACDVRKQARAERIRSLVRRTTIDIHRAGVYPSQHRVRQSLSDSIDMRDPSALHEWKQTLVDLGLGDDPGPGIPSGQGC
jgi:DNA-binding XRE family transcriptional regulator